jgi:hypothetical protein
MDSFHTVAWRVVAIYFRIIGGIAWWVVSVHERGRTCLDETWGGFGIGVSGFEVTGAVDFLGGKGQKDAADHFLARRHVGRYVSGASIFASNIGSEHIVGLAAGAAGGGPSRRWRRRTRRASASVSCTMTWHQSCSSSRLRVSRAEGAGAERETGLQIPRSRS